MCHQEQVDNLLFIIVKNHFSCDIFRISHV